MSHRRNPAAALAVLALASVAIALAFAGAAGAASGNESFTGVIVASGQSGERVVLTSPVVAKGVFSGVGRIVEIQPQPGDPDTLERDDIVFAGGSMHLLSTVVDVDFSLDPRTCVFAATISQTSQIAGGTGLFAHAAGTGIATVKARGLAARAADGSCDPDRVALLDVDTITSSGTLSY